VVRSPWFVVRSCSLAVIVWSGALTLVSAVSARSDAYEGFSAGGLHYVAKGHGPVVVLIHAFHMDLRELGWTGNMFESFPGCTHPDGHARGAIHHSSLRPSHLFVV
jgi:hypothetical protein